MEPSSVEDGNDQPDMPDDPDDDELQWSRPQLRTETRSMIADPSKNRLASMEPSSVEDGNSASG